jgi:malate dehydrogenase (oxaloacetate-decarboxylating)
MKDSDVFIGMSKGGILNAKMVNSMADQPIVFALANPDPEITYDDAKKTKAAVVGTGRSDYPNQINNVLAFPGIFKGALAAKAAKITPEMKIAAADAIADCVKKGDLLKGVIVPPALDRNVATIVARAVAKAAKTK